MTNFIHPSPRRNRPVGHIRKLAQSLLIGSGILVAFSVIAADAMDMSMDMSEHAHHHLMNPNAAITKRTADYTVPALELVRSDGTTTRFPTEIEDGRPIILNFIYTTCTAVCPMTSQVFSQTQNLLDKEHATAHLISISIDPEYDTPERLAAYARKFKAEAEWQFYTGTMASSIAMQKAFDAYRGDKMNHTPVTFVRGAPGKPWVRLDGFANPDELVHEYHLQTASK